MSGLSSPQTAYQATLVQQSSILAGSIQVQGEQAPAKAPPGASSAQVQAIGLEAQVAGTLAASIRGESTPPWTPLVAPDTNQYQSGASSQALANTETLLGSLGLGTKTNTSALSPCPLGSTLTPLDGGDMMAACVLPPDIMQTKGQTTGSSPQFAVAI